MQQDSPESLLGPDGEGFPKPRFLFFSKIETTPTGANSVLNILMLILVKF